MAQKHPILASIGSVGATALGNYTGVLGYVGEFAGRTGRFSTLDPNNPGQLPAVAAGSIRDKVTRKIQDDGGMLGQAGATLYQAGMSAADNLARLVLGGGSGSLALAAAGSFGQSVSDVSRQGASPGQALALATASSIFEVLTEKVSLDNLLSQAAGGKKSLKQLIKNAVKAGGVEITEEGMSFVLNQIADHAIMGGNSSFNQNVGQLLAEGMNFRQAREEAAAQIMAEAAQTAIISGLSGGMMSGVTGGFTNAVESAIEHREKRDAALLEKAGKKGNVTLKDPQVRVRDEDFKAAQRISGLTGREIRFFTEYGTENGINNGFYENGVIHVNTQSQNPIAQIVSHELTHSVELADSYRELSKLVLERLESRGANLMQMRRDIEELYRRNGQRLETQAQVNQEIVAKYVEDYLLGDEQSILEVVRRNRSLAERIREWIDKFLAKIGDEKAEYRTYLNKARNLYTKALEQTRAVREQTTSVQEKMNLDSYEDELDWSDPASVRNWADDALSRGEITDEDYDGFLETADQMQIEQSGREDPKKKGRRHSFAGPNARTADINALQTARQLDEQGVANETIRQQTGWFKGMDGKWRFEIDDSGMKYHKMGDAQFSKDHEGYRRYRDLERKFIDTTITEEELSEMAELRDTWANEAPRLRQMVVRGNAKLYHVLAHDALFEQYPQLRDTGIRFGDTDDAGGWWDRERNEIVLSNRYRHADQAFLEGILLHEIQHAIQDIEGFAKGANPEYWDNIQNSDRAIRENDARIAKAEREAQEALKGIPPEVAKDFWYAANMRHADPEGAERLENELIEGEYSDAYNDYSWAIWTLQDLMEQDNPKRTAEDLYRNTAGEIEARNTAGRRNLSAEERKKKPPILGGEDPVFAENDGRQFSITEIQGEKDNYGQGVLLDTNLFDGTNTRRWSEILSKYVYKNFAGKELTVYDENGNAETYVFAREKDRVTKSGSNHSRKVIDELARYRGDNIRAVATIHLPEMLQTSTFSEHTSENSHQWLDQNGWDLRKTFIVDQKGEIYQAILNIGNARDGRKILYAINNIRKIDKTKALPAAQVSSSGTGGTRTTSRNASGNNISNDQDAVKQFSISAVDKRGIASDLRSILNRGGDPAELRRYIGQLERRPGAAEQTDRNAQQSGAQRIIQAARRRGISVQEYLQQNWEQYEVDGEWNREAREALEAERKGRRYSISQTDNQGRELTEEQIKYFSDSKVRDTNGNLLTLYHGTKNGDFTVFDSNKAKRRSGFANFGRGNYFTVFEKGAQFYGGRVIEAYLDIKNPLISNVKEFRKDAASSLGIKESDISVQTVSQKLKEAGYDGTILYGSGDDSDRIVICVTYDSNQSKYVDNLNPTDNPDIRYSISETGEEAKERKTAQQIREEMPEKARSYLAGAERRLLNDLGGVLGVTKFQNREKLQGIVREIADEYLEQGRVREERMDFLFDQAYAEGIVEDASMVQQYGEIRNHLRTTGVTLSRQDQADIADFQDFRKRAFGTVRIVNDGLPVDSAYHELHEMAPNLFPESITHPADQLVRMYEVGQSIRVSEKTLRQFHGSEAENYRKWARNDFDDVINSAVADLRSVREVAEEAEQKRAEKAAAPTTPEEAKEAYKQLKDARKTYEKALAKNLLTESGEIQVGRLLRGEILPEHLNPEKDNIRAITAVYEAKKDYERLTKQIAEYKKHIRSERLKKADAMLESAGDWKDKKVGIAYSRETMERNVYDIVPDRAVAEQVNETYFRPVHEAEAMATRFKNQHRDLVRRLNLSRKVQKGNLVSEAHAVQLLGEAEDNIRVLRNSRGRMKQRDGKTIAEWQSVIDEMWRQSPGLDEQKIRGAVSEFRKIYDQLFQQMNEVRVRNGYEPVNYRQGYFPHFQPGDGDGVLAHFGKIMGIDTQVAALPTTINGLTHTFKPGIQWFGNAQERLGFNTAYDAVEGFDKYIEGVASVIYQTDNIQNLRALESQIRYRTSDEGIRKQVDAVNNDPRLTEEEKQIKINAIYEHGRYTLSNFVIELNEYTNLLANKKSKLDRTTEALIGRRAYTIMKNWESRVGANMIAGNISSALTNFIPLTQAGAQLSSDAMLKGMWGTLKAMKEDDGITGQSTFLTNRRGSDPLVKTWVEEKSEKMSFLMNLIDGFTSDSIVRAAYYQNLKKGLSQAEAMHQADIFASSVMADRSKGAMPTLFESTNPVLKMFTQFQLEVNNQFSEIFKDLPRRFREKGLIVMGGVLMKYFIGAFLFNELYEFFAGRRPALDPISMLNDTVGDLTGYEMPNVIEWISGGDVSFETEKVGLAEAGMNLAGSALGELPFSSGLTMLGIETDGGRLPASSAVPDLTALWQAATEEDWSSEKRWKEVKDELGKLMYVIPPFGGNQVQKLWKGVKAYLEGGSYSVDKEGNDILQYPVYKDKPEDAFWNLVRSAFLGKSSLPEAQDWVDSGFDSLGAKQTAVYQDLVAAGAGDREAYRVLQELQLAAKTEDSSKATVQRKLLRESGLSGDAKAIVYYGMYASDAERELMDKLADSGADMGVSLDVILKMKDINADDSMKGATASNAKRDLIANAALTDEEKKVLYRKFISDSRDDDIALFEGAGLGFDEFLKAHSAYTTINEGSGKASQKALEFAKWVSDQDYSVKQEGLVRETFSYYSMVPADAAKYDKLMDAGLDSEDAYELASDMADLEPEAGTDQVSDLQRWRLCVDSFSNEMFQLSSLCGYMTEDQYEKVERAYSFGVKPKSYVTMKERLPQYDSDRNGSITQAEAKAAIDGMNVSNNQKAVLWQMVDSGWSAKSNPYNKEIGQKVKDSKK